MCGSTQLDSEDCLLDVEELLREVEDEALREEDTFALTTEAVKKHIDMLRATQAMQSQAFAIAKGAATATERGKIRLLNFRMLPVFLTGEAKRTPGITPLHARAIERGFKYPANYILQVESLLGACRFAQCFDITCEVEGYMGSVILTPFTLKVENELFPAMSIDSFVTHVKHRGFGKRLFRFCEEQLFQSTSAMKGVLFAQCVPVEFWKV